MFGEGDMMRHLFSLVSMSADLKDGLRLCKLAEALTGDTLSSLSSMTLGTICERI